jgi:carbon monoxide dehydrogenase subunit G
VFRIGTPFLFLEANLQLMKFKAVVEIDEPVDKLVELIQDPECTLKWLEGLRSVEHISGEFRQPGAKSKVVLDSAAGKMVIMETVLRNDLPESYRIRYDGKGYISFSNYSFEVISDKRTKFTMTQEVELKGALRLMKGIIKSKVKRQLQRSAESFKRFAENQ